MVKNLLALSCNTSVVIFTSLCAQEEFRCHMDVLSQVLVTASKMEMCAITVEK